MIAVGAAAAERSVLTCPCCESDKVKRAFEKGESGFYSCHKCCLTFIWPRPDDAALVDLYEDYGRRYYSSEGVKRYLLSANHYHREIELLSRTSQAGTLLDVGCSIGGFVKAAGELGYEAQGIDISGVSVAVGQSAGLKIQSGDFLRTAFADSFDVITMWATLEHLPEPSRYVQRALKMLRPGGVFLASVPNYAGITQRLIGRKDRYVGSDHLNYWTARGFASYLQKFNLQILETLTFGFNPLTLVRDAMDRGQSCGCEQMASEQTNAASWKSGWIGKGHRVAERVLNFGLLGDSVAVAGRLRGQ
ncbi:MAG TPA: class I SAM-dependent methyltransferase [Candidatus Acidoferrum sp.]|nr:class I SAM-dependent methyltransferase [Candidatus Acidoferrum sp.]